MSAVLEPPRMTAEEFLAWAEHYEGDDRYELVDGAVVPMAPQTLAHADAKLRVTQALLAALAGRSPPCRVIVDSMGIRAAADQVFIPDVMVQCGGPIPPEARIVDDPMIVVEVVSASTQRIDESYKLVGYFSRPSLRHYLIVHPQRRSIVHHHRLDDGTIVVRFLSADPIRLDPPGITLEGILPPAA